MKIIFLKFKYYVQIKFYNIRVILNFRYTDGNTKNIMAF